MSLDINKIIQDSIAETMLNENDESINSVDTSAESEGNIVDVADDVTGDEIYETSIDRVSMAIAPAISAGLGALALRNIIRNAENLDEGSLGMKRMIRLADAKEKAAGNPYNNPPNAKKSALKLASSPLNAKLGGFHGKNTHAITKRTAAGFRNNPV